MQLLNLRKRPKTILFLILFLFLWVPSIQAHTLHVTEDTNNSSVLSNRVLGNDMRFDVRDVGGTRRSFAKFDLSTLPSGTSGSDIEKATLRVFVDDVFTEGNMDLHRVTSTWDESTLTFNNSPTFNATAFVQDVAFVESDEKHFVTVDITTEVKDWIDNPANDFGIALIPDGIHVRFNSKENQGTSHAFEIEVAMVGSVGPQGPVGPQGIQGIAGNVGATGATGATGSQGPIGLTGPVGPQGLQGIQGEKGDNGDTGDQGIQGIAGTNGVDGATGPQGEQGIAGTNGTNGTDGATGATGPQGDQGIQGIAGTDGTNGTNGLNGNDGATGATGTQGEQGIQGVAGTNGTDGESGKDDADGVEITFTREFQYDPGTGAVNAIDINGTALKINPTDPTVTLGGQARTVLASGDIPNTTPQLQQVIIDMPGTLFAGNHKLKLWNTQGDSEVFIPLSEVSLNDGSTWTQATVSAAFSKRYDAEVLLYNDKLWLMGGYTGAFKNDVWSSIDGVTWTQVTANAPWSARNDFSSVVYDNKMWVMGGSGPGVLNDVWYSTDGIAWTQATASATWSARVSFEVVVFNNKMLVVAGSPNGGGSNMADVWSSTDGVSWNLEANGIFPDRSGQSVLVYDNKLWVMGGYGGGYLNDVWSSPDGINWTQVTTNAAWSGRWFSSSVVYDNKMWILGGSPSGGGVLGDVWNSTDGTTWSLATSNPGWTRAHNDSIVFNDHIWLIAGSGPSSQNDVWHTTD